VAEVVRMRGRRNPQASMLAFVDGEERVPPHHPLPRIKRFADQVLVELLQTFDGLYGTGGRPSIPPERLLKASHGQQYRPVLGDDLADAAWAPRHADVARRGPRLRVAASTGARGRVNRLTDDPCSRSRSRPASTRVGTIGTPNLAL